MKPGRKKADGPALSASMWGNPGWNLSSSAWPRCQSWLKVGGMNRQKVGIPSLGHTSRGGHCESLSGPGVSSLPAECLLWGCEHAAPGHT